MSLFCFDLAFLGWVWERFGVGFGRFLAMLLKSFWDAFEKSPSILGTLGTLGGDFDNS